MRPLRRISQDVVGLVIALVVRLMARGRQPTWEGPLPVRPGSVPASLMTREQRNAAHQRGEPIGEAYQARWTGPVSPQRRAVERVALLVCLAGAVILIIRTHQQQPGNRVLRWSTR